MSSEGKTDQSRKADIDEVFLYGEGIDITAKIKEPTDGDGVDASYDGISKYAFDSSLASIKPPSSMVQFGGATSQVPLLDIQRFNSSSGILLSHPSLA